MTSSFLQRSALTGALLGFLLLCPFPASADSFLGQDYHRLTPEIQDPAGRPLSVIEFFDYDCEACAELSPKLFEWSLTLPGQVQFSSSPVLASTDLPALYKAQLYFTLSEMGEEIRIRPLLFSAIQKEHLNYKNPEILTKWLAVHGIDIGKFKTIAASDRIVAMVSHLQAVTQQYSAQPNSMVVVGGKYVVSLQDAGSPERYVQTISEVVERGLRER